MEKIHPEKAKTTVFRLLEKRKTGGCHFSAHSVSEFCCSMCDLLLHGDCAFRAILDTAPDISDVNIMPSGNATFVYDADGNQLQKLSAPNANRMSVSISKIPLNMQHAIVAIEDERFYEHNGIDIQGILRAFVNGVSHGFHFNEAPVL